MNQEEELKAPTKKRPICEATAKTVAEKKWDSFLDEQEETPVEKHDRITNNMTARFIELNETLLSPTGKVDKEEVTLTKDELGDIIIQGEYSDEDKIDAADVVRSVFEGMANLIDVKNSRYGNSVTQPLGIFNSYVKENNTESLNGILIRLDDKLKRIRNSDVLRKNDVSDLIGYLGFLCAEHGWTDFSDLID